MYKYSELRPMIFTEDGSVMFIAIRDHVHRLLRESGAVTMGAAIRGAKSGNSWLMLACVDRLVELGELCEVTDEARVHGQHRVFVEAAR